MFQLPFQQGEHPPLKHPIINPCTPLCLCSSHCFFDYFLSAIVPHEDSVLGTKTSRRKNLFLCCWKRKQLFVLLKMPKNVFYPSDVADVFRCFVLFSNWSTDCLQISVRVCIDNTITCLFLKICWQNLSRNYIFFKLSTLIIITNKSEPPLTLLPIMRTTSWFQSWVKSSMPVWLMNIKQKFGILFYHIVWKCFCFVFLRLGFDPLRFHFMLILVLHPFIHLIFSHSRSATQSVLLKAW